MLSSLEEYMSVSNFNFTESLVISLTRFVGSFRTQCICPGEYSFSFINFNVLYNSQLVTILLFQYLFMLSSIVLFQQIFEGG